MKMARVLGVLLAGVWLVGAAKAEVAPQLAVGSDFACMLSADAFGSENQVRCWDTDGREISTPRVRGVTQLSATEHFACVVSPTQTYCWPPIVDHDTNWRRRDAGKLAQRFSVNPTPSVFRAGPEESACGWFASGSLVCYILKTVRDAGFSAAETRMKSAPENHPVAFAVSENVICDLSAKGEVHCWGAKGEYTKDKPLTEFPMPKLGPAQEVAVLYDRGCVIEDDHLHCWGAWGDKTDVKSATLVAPLSLTMNDDAAFVVDEGKVWRLDEKGFAQDTLSPGKLEHVGLVASYKKNYCSASDTELACRFDTDCGCHDDEPSPGKKREPAPVYEFRIEHQMRVAPAEVAAFDALLTQMADNVYPEKKLLILSTAQFARALSARGKLFVYESLAPVVENADSEYVAKQILPTYARLQAHFSQRFRLFHPSDFAVTAENTTSALRMTSVAVTSLSSVSPAWQDVTLKLGEAMSTGEVKAVQEVLAALEIARPEITTFLARARSKGQAQLLLDMMEYFRRVK